MTTEKTVRTITVPQRGRRWVSGALVRDAITNTLYRVAGRPMRYHEDCLPIQKVTAVRDAPERWKTTLRVLEIMETVRTDGKHSPDSRGAHGRPPEQIADVPESTGDKAEWVARQDANSFASYPSIDVCGDIIRYVRPEYDDSPIITWVRDAALADELRGVIKRQPSLTAYPSVTVTSSKSRNA